MTWEEMEDLKDVVFIVELASDCSIYYCPGTVTKLGGYVHILDETDKILYSYNVKDKTISRSLKASIVRLEDGHDDSKQKENEKNEEMLVKVVTVDDEYISNSTSDGSHLLNIPLHILGKIMEFCVGVECCKWLYKIKEGIKGVQKPRYKARVVARGFTQRAGIDYNAVFSPVVRHTSIRVILSLTAFKDYELKQLDVKTTFLHRNLKETIYMRQPPSFE
ncbi:retrovirus-related pol polyprotein from transposon TNT 1-94, partial [Tanacetum coccineum]